MQMFVEKMQELTRTAAKISRMTIKETDLDALRDFKEEKLPQLREQYKIPTTEAWILRDMARYLIREGEQAIDLKKRIKELDREIDRQRRADARKEERPE